MTEDKIWLVEEVNYDGDVFFFGVYKTFQGAVADLKSGSVLTEFDTKALGSYRNEWVVTRTIKKMYGTFSEQFTITEVELGA